jgi:uncharacterized membrane protein YhfC
MKRFITISLLGLLLVILLAGCAESGTPGNFMWSSQDGAKIDDAQAGELFNFGIFIDPALYKTGIPIHLKFRGNVETGMVRFELRGADGKPVWNSGDIRAGDFSIQADYSPRQSEQYTLGLVWEAGTKVGYNLSWSAIKVGPVILLPGIGMLLVSAAFLYFCWRKKLSWQYVGLGAGMWVLTVALKFLWAGTVDRLLFQSLGFSRETLWAPINVVYYFYAGALTGIFEAGITWLILRKVRWGKATWSKALAFGIGFGVVEALLLGFASLVSSASVLANPLGVHAATLGAVARNNGLLYAVEPPVERIAVIFAHILANVLLFYAIAMRQARWGWISILYKTLLDTPAAFAAFWGVETLPKLWTIAGIVVLFGIIGWWGTREVNRRYPAEIDPTPDAAAAAVPTGS